ncbi:MAG: amidohydrolase family protein, partial [Pseudomonadota bacterium]
MKIDAHHHLWDLTAVSYPWIMDPTPRFFGDHAPIRRDYLLEEFRTDAGACGIEGSVHIQVGAADPMQEARWIDQVAAETDWPMVQVVFCDLTADDVADQLKTYAAMPSVRGVRQIVGRSAEEDAKTGTNTLLANPKFVDGLKRAADLGLSFDLQLTPPVMEATAEVFAKVPEMKTVLCHAGSPHYRTKAGLAAWSNGLESLSSLPNMYCKLSGLGMFDHDWTAEKTRPIAETVLSQFGSDRVMWGSNFPVCSLSASYKETFERHWQLTDGDEDVFGKTA